MISTTLNQLVSILHGQIFGSNVTFDTVTTDSRNIMPGCLFIALKGKRFDAHDFADQAKKAGAGALLVDRKLCTNLPQLVVQDTRLALGELAAWVRKQVSARVVALTGSSGKTLVKEMTASILNQCGNTLYTAGNLNNDIGVPITLLRLTKRHKYAVLELSANRHGTIAWTVGLTRPEVALVNNLAEAHLDGFGSLAGVAKAKGEIYTGLLENGIAIMNADNNDWLNWKSIIGERRVWYFSAKTSNNHFSATNINLMTYNSEFTLQTPIGNIDIFLPLPGRHNISNVLAAASLSMAVGASLAEIKNGILNLKPIPGRLFPILLTKNQLLLDDSYNANVGSMITAAQTLSKMPGYRVMVVGDIDELGSASNICHMQIGYTIRKLSLDRVLSVGETSEKLSQMSGIGKHFFDKSKLIIYLKDLLNKYPIMTILVKGSRSAAMEDIVYTLQEEAKLC